MPTPSLLAALALLFAALPLAAAAENLQIRPGLWKIRTETKNSMMPAPRVQTRTECVSDTEWDSEELMKETENCRVFDLESSAKKLSWKVECNGPGGRMTGKALYRSKGDRVDGRMNMAMKSGQKSMTMRMDFDGERIGDCQEAPAEPGS